MKLVLVLVLGLLSSQALAQGLTLKDYRFSMTDILSRGQNRDSLYKSMNTDLMKLGSSICSNRALVWVTDMKRFQRIDAAKIFLFYTGKNGRVGRKTWWYHVAPLVNEGGKPWVLDPGFPSMIKTPLTITDWLNEFIGTSNCREIRAGQNELIENMFYERTFPERTSYGVAECYYHVTPNGLWTPGHVARHLLGTDSEGTPIPHEGFEINMSQVLEACTEAASSKLGRVFGNPKKKCAEYFGIHLDD